MKKLILIIALLLLTAAGCSQKEPGNTQENINFINAFHAKNVMNLFTTMSAAFAEGRVNPDFEHEFEGYVAIMHEGASEVVFVVIDEDGKAVVSGINADNWRGDESASETEEKIRIHIEGNVFVDDDGEINRLLYSGAYIFVLNDNKCTHVEFFPIHDYL